MTSTELKAMPTHAWFFVRQGTAHEEFYKMQTGTDIPAGVAERAKEFLLALDDQSLLIKKKIRKTPEFVEVDFSYPWGHLRVQFRED